MVIPKLCDERSSACINCGVVDGVKFCGRCLLAPYCSLVCQDQDWFRRHCNICPKLAPQKYSPGTLLRPPNTLYSQSRESMNGDHRSMLNYGQSGQKSYGDNRRRDHNRKPNNDDVTDGIRHNHYHADRNNKDYNNDKTQTDTPHRPNRANTGRQFKQGYQGRAPGSRPPLNHETRQPEAEEAWGEKAKAGVDPAAVQQPGPQQLIPKKCIIDVVETGETVILSVDNSAIECGMDSLGFACLSLHPNFEALFQLLCDDYLNACNADAAEYKVTPGEAFSLYVEDEAAWYRARCLSANTAAILDAPKIITLSSSTKCKRLAEKYANIPEFSCILIGDKVKIGDQLKCILQSRDSEGCITVSLEDAQTGADVGLGTVKRWSPKLELQSNAVIIEQLQRPVLDDRSHVVLVEAKSLDTIVVRRNDDKTHKQLDLLVEEVNQYGRTAPSLAVPPVIGQLVIAKSSDGLYCRALCTKTNRKNDRYLLEFVENGNIDILSLESLRACPASFSLSRFPALTSSVKIECEHTIFTESARQYLNKLRDQVTPLLLTIPSGAKSVPSGSAVTLTRVDTEENVINKVISLCKPGWRSMTSDDLLKSKILTMADLTYVTIPESSGLLKVLDVSMLNVGLIGACTFGNRAIDKVFGEVTQSMGEYCNSELGQEPYLPRHEELCIARCPPYEQWFRAAVCSHKGGSPTMQVIYIDYGNMGTVNVKDIRKMLPEFLVDAPALSCDVHITGFPESASPAVVAMAQEYMKMDEESGFGLLKFTKCVKSDSNGEMEYHVEAPGLIEAIKPLLNTLL